jgi:predicted alpha/beta hydrolase family esterase
MINIFIIPGLGNSGPEHWQTWMEDQLPGAVRIQQKEWDAPACEDWISSINTALNDIDPSTVVLVGHSLGCVTIARWAEQSKSPIRGAMLVAPSDIESPVYEFPATGFTPIPLTPIPFPTIVVTSDDDHWVSLDRAKFFAAKWGRELVNIGHAGHINAAAGFGHWPEGIDILKKLF